MRRDWWKVPSRWKVPRPAREPDDGWLDWVWLADIAKASQLLAVLSDMADERGSVVTVGVLGEEQADRGRLHVWPRADGVAPVLRVEEDGGRTRYVWRIDGDAQAPCWHPTRYELARGYRGTPHLGHLGEGP